jgi:outer membrane protein insertion porin family
VQGLAYAEYAEQGYLYVGVDPQETVRDSDLVDITFALGEGLPSKIRYVNISGNRMTREKVIRRELALHEGDRFKRSALMRTQGDLSRLGLFEEVIPDFAPAESTDVDINIKVKEKQVGTASAGAGYTGTTGLTGFLELGHNNVLGNGQSLALHLERGARRSDYSLSFTEPWFRDTPTLLGMSAFNMSTELDLYREQRRGGSARIGRPLPWPDYSRGSIGYSLEDVTISQFGVVPSAQDEIVFGDLITGKPVRTSSVLLDFSRNSTDNAFYPTRGTRLTWTGELAGGPFLGAVNFIKNRVEGRLYLPSFTKRFTTMVRARIGVLGIWTGQGLPVPPYERFRLGGGTVADPLRGYEDYAVVPEKFIRDVVYRRDTTWTDTTHTVVRSITPYSNKVRYPGGRYMALYSVEQQFPIVVPLRGVLFFDAGNTWDQWAEIQPFKLKLSAGVGFRMEIPMLGNIGFDYGYGFNRDDGPRWKGHFLLGNVTF